MVKSRRQQEKNATVWKAAPIDKNDCGSDDHMIATYRMSSNNNIDDTLSSCTHAQQQLLENNNNNNNNTPAIRDDLANMILLVILYTIQGVPTGLAFGSIPFLIQQNSSYTELGIFSFASYPYSLKLLWSPIVDSLFIRWFGRRKSWIIPIQFIAGLLLLYISSQAHVMINTTHHVDIRYVTSLFFVLIFLMATQDIAVDGWALELLHKHNIGYASTCQTIGLNLGFFSSYTIFLALNSPDFCNSYLRSIPEKEGIVSLGGYLAFWGIAYLIITVFVALFKHEKEVEEEEPLGVINVYKHMLSILKLPNMRTYIVILLTCKLGFVVADSVTPLKLVEKGFRKDNLAVIVTLAFPFEFIFAILAGKWARGEQPLDPWKFGFKMRTCIAMLGMLIVYFFPQNGTVSFSYYALVLLVFLLYSLSSNFMVVSQGGFFAKISDSRIGGTYMTFLNTLSNFGGTYPKFFIFYLIDLVTTRGCVPQNSHVDSKTVTQWGCVSSVHSGSSAASSSDSVCGIGSECLVVTDGYYVIGSVLVVAGLLVYSVWTSEALNRLQRAKPSTWRITLFSPSNNKTKNNNV